MTLQDLPLHQTGASPQAETPGLWHLKLLGAPRLFRAGDTAIVHLDRRTAALLAYLAIAGPTSRSRVAGLLWPDTADSSARNNLRQLLHRLRGAGPVVQPDDPLSLHPDVQVDVAALLRAAADARYAEIVATTAPPSEMLAGMDYADCDDLNEWMLAERERIRQAQRAALESEADRFEREGDINAALAVAHILLEMELASEAVHRRIMRLHHMNNDRPAALQAYHRCQAILKQTLGVEPLPETVDLAKEIARGAALPAATRRSLPISLLQPPVLAGRQREWAAMEAAWDAGQVIFLAGDPGLGKTRLAFEFAARKGQFLRHEGRPWDAAIPYAHFARAARQMLESGRENTLERWVRRELARIVPELYPEPPPPISSHDEKIRFFEALQRLLLLSAGDAVTVVVDDTHNFHPAGVEFGDYLVSKATPRNPLPGGLRWIHTFRPEDMPAESARQVEMFVSAGIGVVIEVTPLDDTGVRDLLHGLAIEGLERVSDRVTRHTGGNPLFIIETLKTLFEAGGLNGEISQHLPLPQRVGAVIRHRLDRLSKNALKLARAIAVAGPEFTTALAAAVVDADETRLADAVAELEAAQIARRGRFTHDLLMEAVLASIPARIGTALNRSVANYLEASSGDPARIAQHWEAAGHPTRALPWLVRAADAAVTHGARQHAVELLERVAAQADPGSELQVEAMLRLGVTLAPGDTQRARQTLRRALEIAENRDHPTLTAEVLAAMAEVAVLAGSQLEAISLIGRASAVAPPDIAPDDRDRLLAARFRVYSHSGDLVATEQALGEAMQQARRTTWQPFALALLRWHQGSFRDSARILEQLLKDRPEVAQIETVHNNLGMCYWALGEPATAERWIEESVHLWQGTGNLFSEALSRSNLGLTRMSLGKYSDARADLQAAKEIAIRLGSTTLVADALNRLGTLYRQASRLQEAVVLHQESLDLMRGVGDLWRLSYIVASAAAGLADSGDVGAAQALAQEAFDLSVSVGYAFGIPIRHRCMAEVALRAGDRKKARLHAAQAVEASRRYEMAEQLGYSLLLLAHCLARPNGADARHALREALEIGRERHLSDLRWRAATRLANLGAGDQFATEADAALKFLRGRAPRGWLRQAGSRRDTVENESENGGKSH